MSNECFLKCDNSFSKDLELCNDCQLIYFCSPICKSIHKGGRSRSLSTLISNIPCLPFKVEVKSDIGRCLVAVRDIKASELVLVDTPVVKCPQSIPICPVCLSKLPHENIIPCKNCQLPTCGIHCSEMHVNHSECVLYKDLHSLEWTRGVPNIIFSAIGVIRYLDSHKKIQDQLPDLWMDKLMDHLEDMVKDDIIRDYLSSLVEFLQGECGLNYHSASAIKRAYGILRVNSVGMEYQSEGRALFPILSMFSHSCVSNLFFEELNDSEVLMLAQRNISQGEELSIRYISFMTGTNGRQSLLMDQWYFKCNCIRCNDPTELGTFSSCLRCEKPCDGLVEMGKNQEWSCNKCFKVFESSRVCDTLGKAAVVLSNGSESIDYYENAIIEISTHLLSPKHFLVMKMRVHIISLYLKNQRISEMSERCLISFIEHHMILLSYLDSVDPGRSLLMGSFLKHFAQAKTYLLTLRMKNKSIELPDALKEMKGIAFIDKQVKKMMSKYIDR
ncbi:uncharacterized protein [Lepeophtheirus salmonis]|uniref:uncharacterized protein n=1 Tax=Lepeophtheirus salmonis TaxID=72036 RepID=UPI001AE175E1|nr:histone-lysine N-methyltransferase ATXR4-like [Lepeophtheirus salmonis]